MKMKFCFSFFIALWLVLGQTSPLHAQGQRLESMRIAFITQDLSLTTAQGEKFWPLFNEYASKRKVLRERVKSAADKTLSDAASDAEVNAAVDELLTTKRAELDLFAEYVPRFRAVITPHQLGKLVTLEKRFAREMIKRRNGQPNSAASPD